jgi:sodium/hydrogen antiporter
VALAGLGLSIDRPISLRGWGSTWRLLGITMPLTIATAAFLGWWAVGLIPAAALLFGAALAPTDPVLALDVQTGPPVTGDPDADETDEVRFGLTSESALNDGLAFPFTNLAILVAAHGAAYGEWLGHWLLVDVGWKILAGVVVGWLVGKALGWVTMGLVGGRGHDGVAEDRGAIAPTLMALAITLASYAIAELVHSYGFIAVFVSAYAVRNVERENHIHDHLHKGAEQLERFAMSVVLVLVGAAFVGEIWREVTWQMMAVALLLVLVVRPVAGRLALLGDPRTIPTERWAVAFYGIRGLGTLYYIAYGLNHAEILEVETVWALTIVTIMVSLTVHGLTARPAMRRLERCRAEAAAAA